MKTVLCILAGGKSSRFKEDKRWAKINGKPLIRIVLEKLKRFSDNIVISSRSSEEIHMEGVTVVSDSESFGGPLCGIFEVVKKVQGDRYVFFAADMPFITDIMIRTLIDRSEKLVVMFQCRGKIYPLPIAISRHALDLNRDCKNRRIMSILDNADYEVIDYDSQDCIEFFNINTQDDLLKATEYLLKPNKNTKP